MADQSEKNEKKAETKKETTKTKPRPVTQKGNNTAEVLKETLQKINAGYEKNQNSFTHIEEFITQVKQENDNRDSLTTEEIKNVIRESLSKEKKINIPWKGIICLLILILLFISIPVIDNHRINAQKAEQMRIINDKLEKGILVEENVITIKNSIEMYSERIEEIQNQISSLDGRIGDFEKVNSKNEKENENTKEEKTE